MSYAEHYSTHKWIKVKRFERIEENSWEDNYNRLECHHQKETSFLIEEVRKLAALLDEANRKIQGLEGETWGCSQLSAQQNTDGSS